MQIYGRMKKYERFRKQDIVRVMGVSIMNEYFGVIEVFVPKERNLK